MKSLLAIATLLSFFVTGSGSTPQRFGVVLTWSAPAPSADPVAGYNVYRADADFGVYTKINEKLVTSPTYKDDTVQLGARYTYYVSSVDAHGRESLPSRTWRANIPNQLSDRSSRSTAERALLVFMLLAVAGLIAVGLYMLWAQRIRASTAR